MPTTAPEQDQEQVSLPTVAPISSGTLDSSDKAIEAIRSSIPPEVNVTASPYSYGHDASSVTLPTARERPMQGRVSPVNNSVEERRNARQINTWSSVSNTIAGFRNKQESDKTAALTSSIATVMKAQQQVDNATQVLKSPTSSDQDKQMAQGVIDQNKKIIEGKLTDPKTGKQILKAFDISPTDPESQKTPEVAAAKAAAKQVQQATQHGLTADNPAEKAIQDKVTGADAGGQLKQQVAQAQQTTAKQNPSATPYADTLIGKSPATISSNPEYAAQVKQKEDRDKLVTQYVIPKLITAETDREKVQIQQEGLNNRAEYAGVLGFLKQAKALANAADIADARNKMELKKQAMSDGAALMRTQLRVNAMLKVAADKKLDPENQAKVKSALLDMVDKQVAANVKAVGDIQTQIAANKDAGGGTINKQLDASLQNQLKIQQLGVEQSQDMAQKTRTQLFGTPVINPADPTNTDTTKPYTKVQDATGSTAATGSNTTGSVSDDDADSSKDDSTDDSGEENAIINSLLGNLDNQ